MQLYSSVLAVVSMAFQNLTASATRYNIWLLFCISGVYVYRDIWPLATYTTDPKDSPQDELIWVKMVVLAFTAWFVPLFIPRRYIPVDPEVFSLCSRIRIYKCFVL